MGRILCIDYGRKRCGVAVTDSLRIVANGIDTVPAARLIDWLRSYTSRENVDLIIVGRPTTLRGEPSESMTYITPFVARLRKELPDIPVEFFDERFTSTLAHKAMLDGGMRQKARRDKATVDRIAAAIILNDYLQSKSFNG